MDNFTIDVKSLVSDGLNPNFTNQILEIVGPLSKSCSKFSQNLNETLEKIDKLIISTQFNHLDIDFDQSDTRGSILLDNRKSFQSDNRKSFQSDARGSILLDNRKSIQSEARGSIFSDNRKSIQSDSRKSFQSDGRKSIQSENRGSILLDNRKSTQSDARGSILLDNRKSIQSENRGSILSDNRKSIQSEARGSILLDNRKSTQSDTRGSILLDNRKSTQSESRGSILLDNRKSIQSDSRKSIQSDTRGSIFSDNRKSIQSDSRKSFQSDGRKSFQSGSRKSIQFDPVNTIETSELDPEMSKIRSDVIELIPKWQMIFTEIEKISSSLNAFSLKMEDSVRGILSEKKEEIEDVREPLPTQLSGKRFSANNFIDVLRFFPVPMTSKRKEEVQLRKDVILAHYQYHSAVRILEDLKQLPFEQEVVELVKSATITVDNTHKLLLNKCTELILFNEYYKEFIEEYFIALDEPSGELDYGMEFEGMISRARNSKLGVGIEIKEEIARFKKWTEEIESAIKMVIPKQVEEPRRSSLKFK